MLRNIQHVIGLVLVLLLSACIEQAEEQAAGNTSSPVVAQHITAVNGEVDKIASEYLDKWMQRYPEGAYFYGLEASGHDSFSDNSPKTIAAWQATEDRLLQQLAAVDVSELLGTAVWINHGTLKEALESSIEQRVCRQELWGVDHMGGWHLNILQVVSRQPLASEDHRAQALRRWSSVDELVDREIANLNRGLAAGYSAARAVAERVVAQLDGVLALPVSESPFAALAPESADDNYRQHMLAVIDEQLMPALARYRDYLRDTYVPNARESLSLYQNTDGEACYQAMLRGYTSLKRSPDEVYALGEKTVASHRQTVIALGRELFGVEGFVETVEQLEQDESDRYRSKEEILTLSREIMQRAHEAMPDWFGTLPGTDVVLKPFPEYMEGTGRSAHYEAPSADKPGAYWIPLYKPELQRKSRNEVTAVHEAWPGHHLQIGIAQELKGLHPVLKILGNSGFVEGWARYSEALAEEAGLYTTRTALIARRTWPARGLVVDPGLHAFGWTRQQAIDFIAESRIAPLEAVADLVDRIATIPGQMTAYDSGGLEFFALRELAEKTLGDTFDIREFHSRVLENGMLPLPMLREYIEAWLGKQTAD